MQKMCNLIGLPVLEMENGTQIGEVQEVVLNLNMAMFCGLVVEGATWFNQERGIFFQDLFSIGHDAITVNNSDVVQDFSELLAALGVCRLGNICGSQVYTETGDCLGTLVDVVCEITTGEVRFYELSDGFVTDFLYGRLMMPVPPAQVIEEDTLIVPAAMAKLLHVANQESGGVP